MPAHNGINNLFRLRRDHVTASEYRAARAQAFEVWSNISGAAAQAQSPLISLPITQPPYPEAGKLTVPLAGHKAMGIVRKRQARDIGGRDMRAQATHVAGLFQAAA